VSKRRWKRPGWKGWVAIVVAVLVIGGGAGGWLLTRGGGTQAAQALTVQVTSGTVKQTVSASGTIEPAKTADLDFGVSGTVTKVYVAAGDKVVKGQALAVVDDTALVAARTAAQASYDAAVSQHTTDVDAGASDVQLAADQTAVVSAQASLDSAKQDVTDAVLRSTINGTVSSLDLAVGDVVGSSGGGNGLSNAASSDSSSGSSAVTVASTNKFIVNATVAADEASQVKKGMQAQITATGSSATIYGTVQSVGLVAQTSDGGAAVFPVTIAVTGAQKGLYAGTSATASVIVKQVPNVVSVMSRAVQSSGGSTYVMKLVGGKAVKTPVTVGTVYGASTQILAGLKAGDTVQVPGITLPSGTGNRNGGGNGRQSFQFGGGGGFVGGPGGAGLAGLAVQKQALLGGGQ
jgi:macrolide-specific efflux system membrane fusion protein